MAYWATNARECIASETTFTRECATFRTANTIITFTYRAWKFRTANSTTSAYTSVTAG